MWAHTHTSIYGNYSASVFLQQIHGNYSGSVLLQLLSFYIRDYFKALQKETFCLSFNVTKQLHRPCVLTLFSFLGTSP